MAVFIEAYTEPFEAERQRMATSLWTRNEQPVRRPLRGIQIKENTYAIIRVMGSNGEFLPVIDAAGETYVEQEGASYTTHYTNFLVQSVAEERHEKQQIVDTFGESYIFFFGEAPRLLRVSGLLLNTADFNWRAEFWHNYEKYFRGTRLVEMGARLYLIYDDVIIEGYMVGANANENSAQPHVIPFNFQIFVTGYTDISMLGDPNFPQPNSDIDYTALDSYSQAIQIWQQNRQLQTEISTDAVARARRQTYLGHNALISEQIRDTLVTVGDPSVAGFLVRAVQALRIAETVKAEVRSYMPQSQIHTFGTRSTPVRGRYTDNTDEFLGGDVQEPTAAELAAPLSMADRWLEADRACDNAINNIVRQGSTIMSFSPPAAYEYPPPTESQKYWDLMGRAGRAQAEIKEKGGYRQRGRRPVGQAYGSSALPRPPVYPRSVPYGMMTDPGELI